MEKNDILTLFSERLIVNPNENHLPELLSSLLKKLLMIEGVTASSVFLLDKETYEFEQRASVPYSKRGEINSDYDTMLNSGLIGQAVSTLEMLPFDSGELNSSQKYLICPMTTGSGAIGVIIIQKSFTDNIFTDEQMKVFQIWLSNIALNIENIIQHNELKKNKEIMEQRLAVKTMTISQNNRELEAIMNAVQAAILVIEPENNIIISANPVASSIIGDNRANIVGKQISDYFLESECENSYDDNVKFSKNFESEINNVRNIPVPILRSSATINLGNRKLRIESFFDITERKMSEIALRQSNELLEMKVEERTEDLLILVSKLKDEVAVREKAELEVRTMLAKEQELNELKSRFVSLVSHEFRTPLTIIRSAAQVLHKYHEQIQPEQMVNYLTRIMYTVDNMTDLMENVLFIGKSDNSRFSFNPQSLEIGLLIKGIIEDSTINSELSNRIVFEINTTEQFYLVDEVLIRRVLLNLISNALKYSDESSEIVVSISENDSELLFSVRDQGIGIPEEEQDKIFEQFYRGSNAGTINGTGLGMTVVMRSIKMHNGRIEVISNLNEVTIFNVIIPKAYEVRTDENISH